MFVFLFDLLIVYLMCVVLLFLTLHWAYNKGDDDDDDDDDNDKCKNCRFITTCKAHNWHI